LEHDSSGAARVRAVRYAATLALTATIVSALPAAAAMQTPARRLKACIIALNEPHETEAFRANLDPKRFEIVNIRAIAAAARPQTSAAPGASASSWLLDACTPQTQCDLMIYSAEFAGRFFGKEQASLSLQELEEASCQARCAGLFRQPREVFLLACNTLATKDEDSRTPEDYLQVLLDHGFDRASAERVVELRYGPLGPSFRESLRRIFAGVPRIYGFSSVAPRGEYTAPMLTRYLRGKSDYADTLLRTTATDTRKNHALLTSFKGTSLTQTTGLTVKEAGALDRKHICALYDESRPVAERLWIAYQFLLRPDALSFVPTLQVFLSRHPPETLNRIERSVYGEIQRLDNTQDAVLRLVKTLNVSALKLELAHFALLVGWLDRAQFHTIAADGAAELLQQPLNAEVVDIMCEITKHEPLHDDFTADDIPSGLYRSGQGLRLLSCLAPSDPRVTGRVLAGLGSSDPLTRQWAVYTLTQRHPLDERVLEQLVPHLRDPSPDVVTRVRWVFQTHDPLPKRVARTIRLADELQKSGGATECGVRGGAACVNGVRRPGS
jgi:hypothetical protein